MTDFPGSFCTFPAADMKSVISPRSLDFFLWEMVFRDNNLGTRSAQCFWVVFRPFLWLEWGNMYHTDTYHTDSFYSNSALQGFYSLPSIFHLSFLSPILKILIFYINKKLFFWLISQQSWNYNTNTSTINTITKNNFSPQFPLSLGYILVKMCSHLTVLWIVLSVIIPTNCYIFKYLCFIYLEFCTFYNKIYCPWKSLPPISFLLAISNNLKILWFTFVLHRYWYRDTNVSYVQVVLACLLSQINCIDIH